MEFDKKLIQKFYEGFFDEESDESQLIDRSDDNNETNNQIEIANYQTLENVRNHPASTGLRAYPPHDKRYEINPRDINIST